MAIIAASVEANGWVLRLTVSASLGNFTSYSLDPDGTPRVTLASSHGGFIKSGGQAVAGSIARGLIATKPLRLPVNPASPTIAVIDEIDLGGGLIRVRIALTEHVYASDTAVTLAALGGWRIGESAASGVAVTNNSVIVAPIPIMRWALVPYATTTGAFTLALFVASHHPVGFEPVAGVKFTATDGSGVKTVWTTQLSTDTSSGDGLRCYTAMIDPAAATALTAGLLRCDAEVYPWLGAVRTTDATGTRSMGSARTDGYSVNAAAPWIVGYDPASTRYGSQFAFVDPVNGTATAVAAMVQATLAGARGAASRPKDINTAIQAGYLANRTLPAANGQAAQTRSIDGMQIVLAAGTHVGAGSGAISVGIATAEIGLRIMGDPGDSNPRGNVVLQTSTTTPSRISRTAWSKLTVEQGTNTLASNVYNQVDDCTFRAKTGLEANNVAPFSAAAPAGMWNTAITRSRWWRTGASIASGNNRVGVFRACETSRPVLGPLIAIGNRLIPRAEDGFGTPAPMFGGWGGPTLAGQAEDIVIAWNDMRGCEFRAWQPPALPATVAGTPNQSFRRQVFMGNVVERIGSDPSPFYGIGEDQSATISYNIIEGNSFVGDRANTFYSDPLPTTIAEANSLLNQAFVNRVANNVFDWLPTKQDDFNDNTTAALRGTSDGYRPQMIEAWSMLYGVGHESNVDTRRTGFSLFPLEFSGARSVAGYGGPIAPLYTDDRSILGASGAGAAGGGNYRPLAGSPLGGRCVRGNGDTDAGGQIRRMPFTAGAYQTATTELLPAVARSAQRASASPVALSLTLAPGKAFSGLGSLAVLVGWNAGLHPLAARHSQAVLSPWLEPAIRPETGFMATRAGAAPVGLAVVVLGPATARSAQMASAPNLGLAIALASAAARSLSRSAAPLVSLELMLTISPGNGRLAPGSGAAQLFTGSGAVAGMLIVGADPRTVFPNRD